ncbi:MAG TPA: GTPase Era [Saprospiraceae bacterium]|nr:GTPase Era [Saprospiraceae bacterium]
MNHKSGFVNIIGRPNVGKSTLMNALVGERMSIITNKPQTTRHRIIGILSDDDYQIVFSDTPGIIESPAYKMQNAMNSFVNTSFEDADIMLFVTELAEKYTAEDPIIRRLKNIKVPLFLVINKIDLATGDEILQLIKTWNDRIPFQETIPISALNKINTDTLLKLIIDNIPEGPVYYPKDQLTDKSERFFVSEIIREKILILYRQEIPYSCEVIVDTFKKTKTKKGEDLVRIHATIFVARKTQKPILIGKNGMAIKKLGTEARKSIESFLEQKVFLELHIKVKENWRNDERMLKHFGYKD